MLDPRPLALRLLVPAAVVVGAVAPLAAVWASGLTLAWLDTQNLYAPLRGLVDEALREGRLPLWNPHNGTGMPLFAEAMHGVLHPVSLAVAWLGTGRSADLLVGGHVSAAAAGAWWLAREMGASRGGAAVAGLAYGLSGFVLSMAGNLVYLAGAGSLPFALAGLRRAGSGRGRGVVAGSLGTVALALAGDAQALMVSAPLGLLLAWEGGGWRGLGRGAAAGLLGLLLAAVQLLPAAVHLPRTLRGGPLPPGVEAQWSLEPGRLPELLLAGYLDAPLPTFDPVFEALAPPGRRPPLVSPLPFAASVFVGLVPLALAVVGARAGRRGKVLWAGAGVLAWVAMGTALGAHEVLRHVPIWESFRYMEKAVGPLTLVVAVLAALGADEAVGRGAAARRAVVTAAALGGAALVAGWLVAGSLEPGPGAELSARIGRGAWHVGGALAAMLAWALGRERLGPVRGLAALAAATWLGGAAASGAALRPGDPEARLRAPGPVLDAPPPGPRVATPHWNPPPDVSGLAGLDAEARVRAELAAPVQNVRLGIDAIGAYTGMMPLRLLRLELLFGERWDWAARRFGVTHALIGPPIDAAQARRAAAAIEGAVPPGGAGAGFGAWATPHRPWASFPLRAALVGDLAGAVRETYAVISGDREGVVLLGGGPPALAPGRVLAVERAPERVRIEAEAAGPATLVVADAWWEGWEATVDGSPVPILLADALVRAVPFPAGRHVVEMRYDPPEVRAGWALSALGGALLAGWILVERRRAARAARP